MTPERVYVFREPRISLWHPDWWHQHGIKMQLIPEESTQGRVVIRGSAAELVISTVDSAGREAERQWDIKWTVIQSPSERATGNVRVQEATLRAAFGFDDSSHCLGEWLVDRYGASSAEQGAYIRYGNFLNIPGPGTGHDGDPNISLELTDQIKLAVAGLLFGSRQPVPSV